MLSCRTPALYLLSAALSGCASIGSNDKEPAKPAPPVKVEVQAPAELERLLETNLDLARLALIAPGATITESELTRLVAEAPAQARTLLRTEGYFNARVTAERRPGTPPVVHMTVDPGPQAKVRDVRIAVEGPLAQPSAPDEPHAREVQKTLRDAWPLPAGTPFRNPVWNAAKRDSLTRLRAQAYLDANWLDTSAQVDAATQQVDLALAVQSGQLYRTGSLQISGLKAHDEQTVRNLANFGAGTIATEKLLLDYQERLQSSGLFESATVLVAPNEPDPAAAPVAVRLTERQLQQATFGVGVSADVGVRGTVEHVHRRVFGYPLTARNKFEISQVRSSWEGELSTHTLPGLYRNLIGGAADRLESDTDVVTSGRVRIGRAQETPRFDRLYFVEAERSLRRTATSSDQSNAIAVHAQGIWRNVDSLVLPTRGQVLSAQVAVGQASSDPGSKGPFSRLYARARGFWPLGSDWHSQARLEVGQVFVRSDVTVPESLRFRAGGDDSVRGYSYRSLTPQVNGLDTGGKVLFTTSVEVAHPLVRKVPDLWGAVFVDAGRAADRWGDLKPAVGAGVGLRYRSPIGPVSLDLAYGEEVRRFRLHLNVGVTF